MITNLFKAKRRFSDDPSVFGFRGHCSPGVHVEEEKKMFHSFWFQSTVNVAIFKQWRWLLRLQWPVKRLDDLKLRVDSIE